MVDTHIFHCNRNVSVTYRLPGNMFTRLWFFIKLIIIGEARI